MKRSLEEIINGFGIDRLQRTPNGFRGCCAINPDHYDTSPSMHIHVEKGLVKCFSCGAFKTLFDFLIENDVPFDEAVDFFFTDFEQRKNKPEGMQEWSLGRKMPKSMLDRGFLRSTLKHFGAGYDEFEKRITIPLRYKDILYGIQYRKHPKKFWTSDGFVKDNFIYNYKPTEKRVYTEGFTDTWRIWQNGTKDVSGILTASPSEGQLSLMKHHKEITLALDNDIAGFRGAFKINKELGRDITIYVAIFPGNDAGELDKNSWQDAIKNKVSFTEFEVQMITRNPELYEKITKNYKKL